MSRGITKSADRMPAQGSEALWKCKEDHSETHCSLTTYSSRRYHEVGKDKPCGNEAELESLQCLMADGATPDGAPVHPSASFVPEKGEEVKKNMWKGSIKNRPKADAITQILW